MKKLARKSFIGSFTLIAFLVIVWGVAAFSLRAFRYVEKKGNLAGSDDSSYVLAIRLKTRQWLEDPKSMPLSNTQYAKADRVLGRIRWWLNPVDEIGFSEGCLALGIAEWDKLQKSDPLDQKVLSRYYSDRVAQFTKSKTPTVCNSLDAYAFMQLPTDKKVDSSFIEKTYVQSLLDSAKGEPDIPYLKTSSVRFVDTVGMVVPALVQSSRPEAIKLAESQIIRFRKFATEPKTGLVFHAFAPIGTSDGTPLGAVGWGRGQGWFAVGLIELAEYELKHQHPDSEAITIAKDFAQSITKTQRQSGAWSLLINSDYADESSSTAMLGYFLAKGRRLGIFGREVDGCVERAKEFLKTVTRKNGSVDNAQVDASGLNNCAPDLGYSCVAQGFTLAFLANATESK